MLHRHAPSHLQLLNLRSLLYILLFVITFVSMRPTVVVTINKYRHNANFSHEDFVERMKPYWWHLTRKFYVFGSKVTEERFDSVE